jgi:hypothetical protein
VQFVPEVVGLVVLLAGVVVGVKALVVGGAVLFLARLLKVLFLN